MVTTHAGLVVPRWASDQENLLTVARQQQKYIDPDAIFGKVDPRDTSKFQLDKMFKNFPVKHFVK
jgi:hypothetical protein